MKIAIVTPLKDELDKIDELISCIESQSLSIFFWIIVENDSTDGSKEKLERVKSVKGVNHFKVLNYSHKDKRYALGEKYATIVNVGFDYVKSLPSYESIDFIGILDSDCLLESNFYEDLTNFMNEHRKLGISSGLPYFENGVSEKAKKDWVIGNCRLWKKECFEHAGYIIGPSADTLSTAKAIIRGWEVFPNTQLKVFCRERGKRINYRYYGESAYFRGNSPLYILLKTINYLFHLDFKIAFQYFMGYFQSWFSNRPKIGDPELLRYFRTYMLKYLKK